MSIIETMARAIQNADRATDIAGECPQEGAATGLREDVSDWSAFLSRAALRAIKPEDVSDGMLEAFKGELRKFVSFQYVSNETVKHSIAAMLNAAGAEQ